MKALLIAEKPSLRRSIEAVYKKHKEEIPYQITFKEQRGHLLTLKLPDEIDEEQKKWSWENLPFHPEEHGGWQYKIIPERKQGNYLTAKERYLDIQQEIRKGGYDFIIHAGDPDQEGQLLVEIVLAAIKSNLPVKRFWNNATTEEYILNALKNLRDNNEPMLRNLLEAAYCRQHSDYRFGMNISRAATLRLGFRAACGRVKTPILGIVCRREEEIKNFVPSTCYGVSVGYEERFQGQMVSGIGEDDTENEEKGLVWFDTREEAEEEAGECSKELKVVKFESRRTKTLPPKLFKLASAQIAAGKLGYDSSETLSIIQSLYDNGYMSYPRTDCEYISASEDMEKLLASAGCVPSLTAYVEGIGETDIQRVKGTEKWVNDAALEQAGHSALCPTDKKPVFSKLSKKEQDIYELVCRQFVSIFLPPLKQEKTELVAEGNGKYFRSMGKTLIDPGYTRIFGTTFTDSKIPRHEVNDILKVDGYEITSKTTACPKRFTDADLIAACEAPHKFLCDKSCKTLGKNLVIGTSATRAGIIKELINKDLYLEITTEKKTKYIVPTEKGQAIYNYLKDCSICKVDLTGQWEVMLEQVRVGDLTRKEFEERIKEDVEQLILEIKGMDTSGLNIQGNGEVCQCPACGGNIIHGRKGYYCSNYKEKGCKIGAYDMLCESQLTEKEMKSLLEGKEITKKIKNKEKEWNQRLRYDFHQHKVEFIKNTYESKESGHLCPKCRNSMTENDKLLKCGCGYVFWKSICGKTLTEGQIENYFSKGRTGVIKGLKGKSGKSFNADIVMKDDFTSGFEFSN